MGSRISRCGVVLAWVLWALAGGAAAFAADTGASPGAAPVRAPMEVDGTSPRPILVSAELGRQALDGGILMFEDRAGTLDLAAVRARAATDWKRPSQVPLSIGYSRSWWWLHLRLRNGGSVPVERLFEMGSALQDYIDLGVVRGDGRVERFATMGDRAPFANRPLQYVNPTVPLTIAPNETLDLYLRLSTHDGLYENLPLTLWTSHDFDREAQLHWLGTGVFCGLFGLLLAYNVFLYISMRHINFALYGGYVAVTLVWRMTFSGDAHFLLWPDHPTLNNQILPLTVGGWFALGALLLCHHLRLRKFKPRINLLMLVFAASSLAVSLLALAGFYALPFILYLPLALVLPLGLGCSLVLGLRGDRRARWVLISWAPLLACGPLYIAQVVGLPGLDSLPHMTDAIQIALAAQMLLLGGSLAEDTNRWRTSLLAAERAARLSQEGLAATLDAEVKQRTQALENANAQLRALTITDALTGVFNRRHFNASLETEIARLQRQGDMPALCLLDVDHFKAYNDRYGHQKGDTALQAIAAELKRQLRRAGDQVFRVGGEEFALLLMPGDLELQRQHIEALRAAVQALQIPHLGNEAFGVITASFGLVQMPPSGEPGRPLTASALYREADRLLYLAKQAGRNCVVSDPRGRQEWAQSTGFIPDITQPAAL